MSGEKTEQPTDKKKEDSKKKGQVAVSKDVLTLFRLAFCYATVFIMFPKILDSFGFLMDMYIEIAFKQEYVLSSKVAMTTLQTFLEMTIPVVVVAALVGVIGTFAQTGFVIAAEAATPSFKKLDPVPTIKNMFSKKSLIQLLISVFKVFILAYVIYWVIKSNMNDIIYSYRSGLDAMFQVLGHLLEFTLMVTIGLFVSLSAIDWAATYFHHLKEIKMSKSEVKDEYKQMNGDPQFKSYLRQNHRRLLNSSLQRVPDAKVVVTNPTHIAVALDYEPGTHDLPFILAMGTDDEARQIREMASKHGIPLVQNVQLARMIYAECEEEEYLQRQHLEMAAAVFKLVFSLGDKRN